MDRPRNTESPIGCCRAIRDLSAVLVLSITFGMAWATHSDQGVRVEVFTSTNREAVGRTEVHSAEAHQVIDLQVYELNGIQLVEAELSKDFTASPDQSKYLALQRIQQLDKQTTAAIQNAAVGLAKAMQYGVDRYPAIVFDGEVVVYGLADLSKALYHYQAWRAGARP